jgi:hypothetical protein
MKEFFKRIKEKLSPKPKEGIIRLLSEDEYFAEEVRKVKATFSTNTKKDNINNKSPFLMDAGTDQYNSKKTSYSAPSTDEDSSYYMPVVYKDSISQNSSIAQAKEDDDNTPIIPLSTTPDKNHIPLATTQSNSTPKLNTPPLNSLWQKKPPLSDDSKETKQHIKEKFSVKSKESNDKSPFFFDVVKDKNTISKFSSVSHTQSPPGHSR